jgi:AcrR family transcriptional regulator
MSERSYHHGDLRAALLRAAEAEVQERGIEAFSLRSVAKRAGVSHAAPAHHFSDTNGLLTALAAEGFRQFLSAQARREERAAGDARSQILAAGMGYIDFAQARPALFRLIFSSKRPDYADPELLEQANAAYLHLQNGVFAAGGDMTDVSAVWAMAHGLADLLASERPMPFTSLPDKEREKVLEDILGRSMRNGRAQET